MTYDLYIGDRMFSSWSMRGWLMLEKWALPHNTHLVGLYAGTLQQDLAAIPPARTVPVMRTPEGHVLTDSLAMAETLVERHPEHDLYPRDPAARALARCLVAEMHSGFMPLREHCPNMLSHRWIGFQPPDAVRHDIDRISALWALARSRHGTDTPWLFGEYSLADVFYAPVAARITAFGLEVDDATQCYVDAHLTEDSFCEWRRAALMETHDPFPYPLELEQRPWPGEPA